jgi:RNA polymerase subunit RPABC4/transcription elongation factor Spt4
MAESRQPPIEKPQIEKSMTDRIPRNRFPSREKFRFSTEIRIIPRWLVIAVAVVDVIALAIAIRINWNGLGNHSALVIAGAVTACSIAVAAYIFLVAYINRDAKRRGMSPTLWTLLVMFLPGAPLSGCIIYFLVREPLPFNCPQCGFVVRADFNFCPHCKSNLRMACPHCGREVGEGHRYCPNCAWELAGPAQR